MNQHLQKIHDFIQQAKTLSAEEKATLANAVKATDSELTITEFKLARTEKVKRTTAILLEETIDELEHKRKAVEEKNRELEIESALEEVRSRSLAMHKTGELQDVVSVVFEKLQELEFVMDAGAIIFTFTEGSRDVVQWIADPGKSVASRFVTPFIDHPIPADLWRAKEGGKDFFAKIYSFEEKNIFFKAAFELSEYKFLPDDAKKAILNCERYSNSVALAKNSAILIPNYNGKLFTEQENDILKRFARVYARFLDLQKAEEQAREAQIEASLERIRSKTMAMHSSQDVADTVVAMFDELVKLGVDKTVRSGIAIIGNTESMELWTASSRPNAETTLTIGHLDFKIHPLLMHFYNAWKNKEPRFSDELSGEYLKDYYKALNDAPDYPVQFDIETLPPKLYHNTFTFPEGAIFVFSLELLPAEVAQVYKRFAGVFGLTYRRFLDLKNAEAQAKEAKIEAGLERVRSRTMAMQKSDELAETATVLFRQMIGLGIEPNRLYIAITREGSTEIEFWITDEDGSKIGRMFIGDAGQNRSIKKMYEAWKAHEKSLVIDMHGQELADYFHYLSDMLSVPFRGGLSQKRRVQYISFFAGGFIGMASPDNQPQETVDLLDRFAYVFNLTYARFNDLKLAELHALQAAEDLVKLQTEKKRAEDALTELRATQRQLIQSEKMASLGELTAGIAHEIQNPLNFVNNFSEVSVELLGELKEEAAAGNTEDVIAIANDLTQNLEKIRHHGKRADGIVKGMLQHSRASSDQKELTDISALADEYLRLAYHGLRAKDKGFNAELTTHFDEKLRKIDVVPQDVGRALINLFNNAFYAVSQKAKTAGPDYKPTVEVSTSAPQPPKGGVEVVIISVKDNGNGIPDVVKDKIMQPFFTTKPTGEGTGLGLSLSYDIVVKGHGGTIEVQSAEGKGSEFIIKLPSG